MGLPEPRQPHVRQVVAAVRLRRPALERLQEGLGEEFHLVDITESTPDAELVICPPCSPQTISALGHQFPEANVVVAEVEDSELGVDVKGPITRSLDAGASAYLVAESVGHLAAMLSEGQQHPAPYRSEPLVLSARSVDDEILAALADLARRRTSASTD